MPLATTVGVRRGGVGLVAGRSRRRLAAVVAGCPATRGGWVRWVGGASSVRAASSSQGSRDGGGSESSNEKRCRMHSDGLDVGWFEKIGGLEVSWFVVVWC
jgi:hypothetical protein